jgi:glutamyl-tRNA synthetase
MSISASSSIRVRFAPSPTGHLHIGGLRTALFNFLFARHNKGSFVIRIEDTDFARSKAEYVQSIIDSLQWTDIMSDESLHIQSEFLAEHKRMIDTLVQNGKAYRCYCPVQATAADGESYFKYDSRCRLQEPNTTLHDQPYVIRLKVPQDIREIAFDDLIHGRISFDRDQIDDFIIARSDGTPIYNFVVVVDDALMNITHVIRGEEHIPNTPRQILLYQALGFKVPIFAHLPLILSPSGGKLSKRDVATSVLDYKKNGFLPEALCNYLVRLGWAHGDQEIFTRQEMIDYFTIEKVGKHGAVFDHQKLHWVNGMYMRSYSAQKIFDHIIRDIDASWPRPLGGWKHDQVLFGITLYKERTTTLIELMNTLQRLHDNQQQASAEDMKKWVIPPIIEQFEVLQKRIMGLDTYSVDSLKALLKDICAQYTVQLVTLAQPIRLALTSTTASPGIFELMTLLGKDETVKRLQKFSVQCKASL